METTVTVVEGEEAVHWELCAEIVVLSGNHLFTHTSTDLGLEVENSTETEITTFTTLVVLRVLDSTTSRERRHTTEDIFVQVKSLLCLGDTTSRRHEDSVEDIRVTVVKLTADLRQCSSGHSTECLFFTSCDITENTNVLREDVFTSTNDSDWRLLELSMAPLRVWRLVGDSVFLELSKNVTDLETFLEIIVLEWGFSWAS